LTDNTVKIIDNLKRPFFEGRFFRVDTGHPSYKKYILNRIYVDVKHIL
jgi:hypothetical protein